MTTGYREHEGDILPAYDGVNQPRYPRGNDRITAHEDMPHPEFLELGGEVVALTKPDIPESVRECTAEYRAREAARIADDPFERFLAHQRQRYQAS